MQNPFMAMQNPLMDLYSAGFKNAAELMQAYVENVQRASRELLEAKTPEEWLGAQTRFTNAQAEQLMQFWSRLWRIAGEDRGPQLVIPQPGSVSSEAMRNAA
jgi:hypothetical protein